MPDMPSNSALAVWASACPGPNAQEATKAQATDVAVAAARAADYRLEHESVPYPFPSRQGRAFLPGGVYLEPENGAIARLRTKPPAAAAPGPSAAPS